MAAASAALVATAAIAGGAGAAGDLSRQTPIEVTVELGKPGQHVFVPNRLRFETGKLYKLILTNPSNDPHYFTSHAFTQLIFTRKVQVTQMRDGKRDACRVQGRDPRDRGLSRIQRRIVLRAGRDRPRHRSRNAASAAATAKPTKTTAWSAKSSSNSKAEPACEPRVEISGASMRRSSRCPEATRALQRQAEAQGPRTSKKATTERGISRDEAERRAWATVNKESGGGNKSGSGRGKPDNRSSSRRAVGSVGARRRDVRQRRVPIGEKGGGDAQASRGVPLARLFRASVGRRGSPNPGPRCGYSPVLLLHQGNSTAALDACSRTQPLDARVPSCATAVVPWMAKWPL